MTLTSEVGGLDSDVTVYIPEEQGGLLQRTYSSFSQHKLAKLITLLSQSEPCGFIDSSPTRKIQARA